MSNKIKELEAELEKEKAKEEAKKSKKTKLVAVILDANDETIDFEVKFRELGTKEKSKIMKYSADLSANLKEIEELSKGLKNGNVGSWLEFLELTDIPTKKIISIFFGIDEDKVTTLPNIELLGYVFSENKWINDKADKLSKELIYISKKSTGE